MSKGYLSIKTKIQVLKPDADVFEAIIDPKKMSNYFISSGSGRMEEGKTTNKENMKSSELNKLILINLFHFFGIMRK